MRLVRNAILVLTPKPKLENQNICVSCEHFKINCNYQASDEKSLTFFIVSEFYLPKLPTLNRNNSFEIPKTERQFLENKIENLSNYLSVIYNCKRNLSSPSPPIAFIADDSADQEFLDKTIGFNLPQVNGYMSFRKKVCLEDIPFDKISDRQEGFALLSESLSTNHANGKYRDLIRLFENAFNCKSGDKLKNLLLDYLKDHDLGYTEQEINNWIINRNPASHATTEHKKINYEIDVLKYIFRMEQAAYYILLNKEKWNDSSTTKVKNWVAEGVTTNEKDIAIKQGSELELNFVTLDHFQSYPLNLNAAMTSPPTEWYIKNVNQET